MYVKELSLLFIPHWTKLLPLLDLQYPRVKEYIWCKYLGGQLQCQLFKQRAQGFYAASVTGHSESQQEPGWAQQPPAEESDGRARPLLHRLWGHKSPGITLFRVPPWRPFRLFLCYCAMNKLSEGSRCLSLCSGKPGVKPIRKLSLTGCEWRV